jgi:hypothetical protein
VLTDAIDATPRRREGASSHDTARDEAPAALEVYRGRLAELEQLVEVRRVGQQPRRDDDAGPKRRRRRRALEEVVLVIRDAAVEPASYRTILRTRMRRLEGIKSP